MVLLQISTRPSLGTAPPWSLMSPSLQITDEKLTGQERHTWTTTLEEVGGAPAGANIVIYSDFLLLRGVFKQRWKIFESLHGDKPFN